MDPYALKTLNAERRARRAAILVTDLGDGRDRIVREGDQVAGDLGAAIAKAFRSGNSGSVEAEGRTFFLNAHLPQPRLVVIGAVHISQALAPMARIAGYPLEIIDPRTLQPFEWPVEVDSRLGLLASEEDAAALPGQCEPLLLEHGTLQPRKVIEDELLLALPLVPVKPGSEILQGDWSAPGQAPQDAEGGEAVTHPFADLRKLLEDRKKHR